MLLLCIHWGCLGCNFCSENQNILFFLRNKIYLIFFPPLTFLFLQIIYYKMLFSTRIYQQKQQQGLVIDNTTLLLGADTVAIKYNFYLN
jgi:hypothetical protein